MLRSTGREEFENLFFSDFILKTFLTLNYKELETIRNYNLIEIKL